MESVQDHMKEQMNLRQPTSTEDLCLVLQDVWYNLPAEFLYALGKYEDDMSYWMNQGRAGNEYYGGFHHHHYDEDSAIGPRNPYTFRHGAGVNYDDY